MATNTGKSEASWLIDVGRRPWALLALAVLLASALLNAASFIWHVQLNAAFVPLGLLAFALFAAMILRLRSTEETIGYCPLWARLLAYLAAAYGWLVCVPYIIMKYGQPPPKGDAPLWTASATMSALWIGFSALSFVVHGSVPETGLDANAGAAKDREDA